MVCEACKIEPIEPIRAPTETLTCKRCGCLYVSSGKNDKGYCRDCDRTMNALLKGGPLNGKHYSGLLEEE